MIATHTWLSRRRRTLGLILALATVLVAVVVAHGGGESKLMSEHPGEVAMEICLATLELGAVAFAATALFARRRLPRAQVSVAGDPPNPIRRLIVPLERPPPRMGAPTLQVFLS